MTVLAALAALALATGSGEVGGALTPEALRARHAGASSLSAEIVQTKEGRYWARPLSSHVRLRWTPGRIEWETLDPVPSTVRIEGDRIRVIADGAERDLGGRAGDPRFAALLRLLQALASFDLAALEGDFALAWGARDVVATPRPGATPAIVTRARLLFDDDGEIRLIEMWTPSEITRLEFQRVTRTR